MIPIDRLFELDFMQVIRRNVLDALPELMRLMDRAVDDIDSTPPTPLEQECARATSAYFDRYRLDPTFFRASIEG